MMMMISLPSLSQPPDPPVTRMTSSPSSWMPPSTLLMSSVSPDATLSRGWDQSPAPTPRTLGLSLWSRAWEARLSLPWVPWATNTKSSRDRSWREKLLRTLRTATSRQSWGGKICAVIPWVPTFSSSPQPESWSTRSPPQEPQCLPSGTISVEELRREAPAMTLLGISVFPNNG